MKIGILGFTGAGKKSIFQLLTGVEPQPHRTGVTPGVAKVHDARVDRLAAMYEPEKVKHAEIEFLLLPDVEIGGTSGADWLKSVRDADVFCMVVRAFDDPAVFHPYDTVEPLRDAQALEAELILADLALVETRLERIERDTRHAKDPRLEVEKKYIEAVQAHLEEEKPLHTMAWDDQMEATIKSLGFLSRRPLLVVKNTDGDDPKHDGVESGLTSDVKALEINVQMELEVAAIEDPEERETFLKELGIDEPAIAALSRGAYEVAGLISFFTVGKDEVRAWTIRHGTLAPQGAGKIHTDLERGFIRAEIVPVPTLLECGSEAAAKSAGVWALKGKDYEVQDGDVMHIRFSV